MLEKKFTRQILSPVSTHDFKDPRHLWSSSQYNKSTRNQKLPVSYIYISFKATSITVLSLLFIVESSR